MRELSLTGRWLASIAVGCAAIFATVPQALGAQFHASSGVSCGSPVALAVQSTTGHIFLAQSGPVSCKGVYRSTNGGVSFSKVGITNPGFSPPTVFDVKNHAGVIYVATNQGVWTTDSTTQVVWTQHQQGLPQFTPVIMVEPINGTGEVFAAVDFMYPGGGLYRAPSAANLNFSLIGQGFDAVAVAKDIGCGVGTIVAASHNPGGLWISRDDGATWAKSLTWPTTLAKDVGFDCTGGPNNGHLYVSNGDPNVNAAVYRSTDHGMTFLPDNQGIPGCCASTLTPVSDTSLQVTRVGSWANADGNGAGLFERFGGPIGAPWTQFSTLGLPSGPVIVDWDSTPETSFNYVVIVGESPVNRVYYFN